ncbi:MAG: hypothetical protein IJZ90_03020, partial [Clostridia bacterium]|nr:hypothetical protein [Clostridia bacterium]
TVTFFLSGCGVSSNDSNTNEKVLEYYDNSDCINIDVASGNSLCFDIVFFTKEKVKNVEFVSCTGENIDNNYTVSIFDNTIDIYRDHCYRTLYCSDWMIEMIVTEEKADFAINSITLLVDEEKKEIDFSTPISFCSDSGNDMINDELCATYFPNEFSSTMINSNEVLEYSFAAESDCTIKNISIGAGIELANPQYCINGVKTVSDVLPIDVKKGETFTINFSYESSDLNRFSYVQTNLSLTYEIDGVETTRKGVVIFNPTSPVDEELERIDSYIDFVISK